MGQGSAVAQEAAQLWHELEGVWHDSAGLWRDDVREEFVRRYWTDLEEAAHRYIEKLEALTQHIRAIQG